MCRIRILSVLNEKIHSISDKESRKFCMKTKKTELYLSEEIDNMCLKQNNSSLSYFTLMKLEEVMIKQPFKYVLCIFLDKL